MSTKNYVLTVSYQLLVATENDAGTAQASSGWGASVLIYAVLANTEFFEVSTKLTNLVATLSFPSWAHQNIKWLLRVGKASWRCFKRCQKLAIRLKPLFDMAGILISTYSSGLWHLRQSA
jgi:hypothetical protein